MGFFSRHRKAFRSVIASFGMLFGLLAGCASNPIVEQEKEPENAQIMPVSSGTLDLGIEGLSASYSGDGNFSYNGSVLSGEVESTWNSKARSATLAVKNTLSLIYSISFTVTDVKISKPITGKDGEIYVWGEKIANAPIEVHKFLGANETFTISLKATGASRTTSISISSIATEKVNKYKTIFKPASSPTFGSFMVDGTQITAETTKEKTPLESYNLKFVPASGQTFVGWDINGELVSNSAEYSFSPTENNQVVFPRVYVAGTAMFSVGGMTFDNLKQAISKAKSGSDKTIAAVKDGIVASGNYTLDSGLSLLIPNEDGATLSDYAKDKPTYTKSYQSCSRYRKITFENGAKLTVYGQIVVCSKPFFTSGSSTGTPSGGYGQIVLNDGSSIALESGSKLYAWGFVTGDGEVWAKSGSVVYEMFQMAAWRGGGTTVEMLKNKQKVFVMNQYYVQNIEALLRVDSGAVENTLTGVDVTLFGIQNPCFPFIGSGGMFLLTSGYLLKKYDPNTDRLNIRIYGNGTLSSIGFSLMGYNLNSADYVLPINNNITIEIVEGACKTEQDLSFLPGSELIIREGAYFEVLSGHNMTFYDGDTWGNYAYGATFRSVQYSPTKKKNRTNADLVDAKLALDGTLVVDSGSYLMTTGAEDATKTGARIISPGRTGVVKFTDASAATCPDEVYQYESNYVEIPHCCAKLQNGDHSYTQSVPGNTYNFDKVLDRWSLSTDHATKSGLFKTIDNNGVIKTVLLENDVMSTGRSGLFHYSSTTYKAGDNHYYYLQAGVVVNNKKWYQEGGKWYFFGTNQYAYQNMSAVFTASTGITGFGIQARYFFNDAATVERLVTVNNVVGLSRDITVTTIGSDSYCYYKSIKAGIGLFEKQSGSNYSVYLAKDDGSFMTNGTYYVPFNKINSIKDSSGKVLTAGLYYFDEDGHMYDSNFKIITRGNAS